MSSSLSRFALLLVLSLWPSGSEAGEVSGSVRLEGPVPAPSVIAVEAKKGNHSTEGCGHLQVSQRLLVDPSGGVAHVVIWLPFKIGDSPQGDTPLGGVSPLGAVPSAETEVALDQKECRFVPHLVIVPPGGKLIIRNSDPVRHNIRIFKEGKPSLLMHRWQNGKGAPIVWRFTEPGRYIVRCGIHPWMHAWVVAAEHRRYAVTDAQGNYLLPDVPPGSHRLRVWHETLGMAEIPVRVGPEGAQPPPLVLKRRKEYNS